MIRFFVLEKIEDETKIKNNFIIQYYTDEKCGKLKGSYLINEDTVIESLAEFDGKGNVISVTSKKSSGDMECLYLSMGTEEERTQWFNAFREVSFYTSCYIVWYYSFNCIIDLKLIPS